MKFPLAAMPRVFLPPANEVWGKVIFLHLFVILFTGVGGGGGIPACIAGGIPACLAAGGGAIPACIAGGIPACLAVGGACSGGSAPGGGWRKSPGRLQLRAVRILLECILVQWTIS